MVPSGLSLASFGASAFNPERIIRSFIYDALILNLTARWYAEVLQRIPEGAAVLDVGIGTAGALLANADQVERKHLQVTGIDIDAGYVKRARKAMARSRVGDCVQVHQESVYDHAGGPYDAVYFSGSFMLLPDPEAALRHCAALLKPDGAIYFTQSIQQQRSPWLETLKPMLRRITTIDFGRVTYAEAFRAQIEAADLELEVFDTLRNHGSRVSCLAVAVPRRTA